MIRTEPQIDVVEQVEEIVCDICGKIVDASDFTEIQEFHHVDFHGGYGSVFGDCHHVQCDICQDCLKSMIYDHCRIDGLTESQWEAKELQMQKEEDEMHDMIPDFPTEGDDEN